VKPHCAKQIVYRHNGDPRYDETVIDKTGEMPFCRVGEILKKNGKRWKVAVVNEDFTMAGLRAVPIHRVFLTDKL
jgi:hypothetical protein